MQLCYVHAAQEQILDLPLDELRAVSQTVGIPMNGIIFVLEAIARADKPSSEPDITWAVIRSAKERFGASSRVVLRKWGISSRLDVGRIVLALVDARVLPAVEGLALRDFETAFTLGDVLDTP